ncbi:MAG TPA: peptidyl-prolyl cis-trans isomerase [Candidatus Angelobacter sp.]|nr:peptidyl-prolyl cis-trans isomerase [Candidatus Angelobacter sp.]
MKRQLITALLLTSAVIAPAQVASHAPSAAKASSMPSAQVSPMQVTGKPVAKVNGVVLTDKDLLREMFAIFPYGKQHNGFPKAQEAGIRQGALEMIIFEELVYQEAQRRHMTIPPAKIDAAEAAYKKTFESPEQWQQFMQTEMHGSRQALRDQIQRSLLIDQLLKQEVDNRAAVTPAEVRAYYDKNSARFQVGESYTFQSISILPPRTASADQAKEARKKADEALKQAKATKSYQDFGLLAEKTSEDDFRVNMGDHKAVPSDKLPPQVIAAFKSMKPGDVSGLIQIETAYTIIRLNTHTLAHKQSFEEVKGNLSIELQKQKYEQLRVNFAKQLRAKAKIEVV